MECTFKLFTLGIPQQNCFLDMCLTNIHVQGYKLLRSKGYFWLPFVSRLEEKFVTQVVKTIERKKEDTHKVKRGWFTCEAMKTELKWEKTLGSNYPALITYRGHHILALYI